MSNNASIRYGERVTDVCKHHNLQAPKDFDPTSPDEALPSEATDQVVQQYSAEPSDERTFRSKQSTWVADRDSQQQIKDQAQRWRRP